ncbi:MAG: HEAT repeat domain-containing protein [Anaerolineae bacterium]|nr:HEAT repeat domain-containing protein [Gloeobacterales cyanobacterium ES-bin-313]
MKKTSGVVCSIVLGLLLLVQCLQVSGQTEGIKSISSLLEDLRSSDYHNRINAIAIITTRQPIDEDAVAAVITTLHDDENPLVRVNAAFALGNLGSMASQNVILALTRALYDESPSVRLMPFYALANIGSAAKGAIPVLEDFEKSSDISTRESAIFALEAIRNGKCIARPFNPYSGKRNFRACK